MHKDTKKNKWPQVVRFHFADDCGNEFLIEASVNRWQGDAEFGREPEVFTDVEILRAEKEDGKGKDPESFNSIQVEEIEYQASEHVDYNTALPRFFANELEQAEAYLNEANNALQQAEHDLIVAERRIQEARFHHKDALCEVRRIQKIQSVPA